MQANRVVSIILLVVGAYSWFAPGFNGYMFEPSMVTDGEGRIAGSVLAVGAAVVWFMRK